MKSTFAKRYGHEHAARKSQHKARERRRLEAKARQEAWDKLSLQERIKIVQCRTRGESKKELAKLTAALEAKK